MRLAHSSALSLKLLPLSLDPQKQQFLGQWRERRVYFCLDINRGFIIYDRANMVRLVITLLWPHHLKPYTLASFPKK